VDKRPCERPRGVPPSWHTSVNFTLGAIRAPVSGAEELSEHRDSLYSEPQRLRRVTEVDALVASSRPELIVVTSTGNRKTPVISETLVGLVRIELTTSAQSGRSGESRLVPMCLVEHQFRWSSASRDLVCETHRDAVGSAGTHLLG
jgi:hypothetical protein